MTIVSISKQYISLVVHWCNHKHGRFPFKSITAKNKGNNKKYMTKWQHLHQMVLCPSLSCRIEVDFALVDFWREQKTGLPNFKLNPRMTSLSGIEWLQWLEARTLTTAPPLLPLFCSGQSNRPRGSNNPISLLKRIHSAGANRLSAGKY